MIIIFQKNYLVLYVAIYFAFAHVMRNVSSKFNIK